MSASTALVMVKARELRAAGWEYSRIQRILDSEFGVAVSHTTVRRWTNPAYAELHRRAHRDRQAAKRARASSFTSYGTTPEYRLAFMERLRHEGLSCASIGKVHGVVFGDALTHNQVRYALRAA